MLQDVKKGENGHSGIKNARFSENFPFSFLCGSVVQGQASWNSSDEYVENSRGIRPGGGREIRLTFRISGKRNRPDSKQGAVSEN